MARFKDLPAEIRNMMYDNLLRGENETHRRDPNQLAMFTVSKQLHQESSSYFYQNNSIAIDAPSTTTDTATVLAPVADKYLRFLKRLTIHASMSHPSTAATKKVATAIAALSTVGAKFDELNLVLSSPLSNLMNSRVDDSVMGRDHPITTAIQTLLRSGATQVMRVQLQNTWFAPGIASALSTNFSPQLEFYVDGTPALDISTLERPLIGRYSSDHLTTLVPYQEDVGADSWSSQSSPLSSPASLSSSLCSAFSDLETFSVTDFELSPSEEDPAARVNATERGVDDGDDNNQPYFSEDPIEEWSASTQEMWDEADAEDAEELGEEDDLEEEEDMEDVPGDETSAFMQNLREVAHHVANGDDITYMTNFAPDLL
jgi:hypothetical protein